MGVRRKGRGTPTRPDQISSLPQPTYGGQGRVHDDPASHWVLTEADSGLVVSSPSLLVVGGLGRHCLV